MRAANIRSSHNGHRLMNDYLGAPLKDFAKGRTQPQIAELLGITQGAVSQMLNSSRDIRIRDCGDGSYQALEIKPIGRSRNLQLDRRTGERRAADRRRAERRA